MSENAKRSGVLLAWLWLAAFTFIGLDRPIGEGDEALHAQILAEMLRAGDYLSARWQGALLLQRPLLPYWLAVPFAKLISGEVGVRWSSACASFATLGITYAIALRLWSRRDVACVAVLLLAGSPSFHVFSRTLMSDPPFVAAVTLALAGALQARHELRRGLYMVGAGLGLAIATKSLAALIPAVALLPALLPAARRAGFRGLCGPVALGLALAAPFYVYGFVIYGARFWQEHVLFNLIGRASANFVVGMRGGWLVYPKWILYADGPAVVAWLALGSVGALVTGLARGKRELVQIGSFALIVFVVFSLVGTRLPHYVLPAYPAAALGAAGCYAHWFAWHEGTSRPSSALLAPLMALLVLLLNRNYPGGDGYLLQGPQGRELGSIARRLAGPADKLYAYEWYGPALGYYGQRKVVLLTSDPQRFHSIDFDAIHATHSAVLVPPAPAPVGQHILIAGDARTLAHTPWLAVDNVVGASRPYFLVQAHVIDPGTPTQAGH